MTAYYPVLLDLRGRRVVVVGGGAVAGGKVAALRDAEATITVVAPEATPAIAALAAEGSVTHVRRAYRDGDLQGAMLAIAAADDADVNAAVWHEANARGIFVNAVDDPPHCSFILPSVARQGALIVAVSTSGHAPALAVRLRERIARDLGPEYGRFLELAGGVREELARRVPEFARRKQRWYELVDSDVFTLLRRGDEVAARERFASILGVRPGEEPDHGDVTPHAAPTGATGKVFLVGAGPGDADLITVAGLRALRSADVVLYDRLISPRLLDEAPARALRLFVGKAPGDACHTQEEINQLLVEFARSGATVVRLKGGDPFVFGRGTEEAEACAANGIAWEVIPGVSSVLGVTARAGIPVTARGMAGSLAVVTGHRAGAETDDVDWGALARIDTLVVLMGVGRLPAIVRHLLDGGRAPETPVAIIERGTLPGERVLVGRLDEIAATAAAWGVAAPATIVIGDVVRLRERLHDIAAEYRADAPVAADRA